MDTRLVNTFLDRAINFARFQLKLKSVGTVSLDKRRNVHADRHQLKYFRPPQEWRGLNWDLNSGFDTWIAVDESDPHYLNDFLDWVNIEKDATKSKSFKDAAKNADFLCYRGFLTKIAGIPYENRDDLKIAIMKYHGMICLCEYPTEQKKKNLERRTQRDMKMTYWGYKFESYSVADSPTSSPDTESPVNNNEAFCTVVRGKLGESRILFMGEVDCVEESTGKYIELKTNRIFSNPRQENNFHRFKTSKWWLQSFLIGIEDIVVGFRNDDGIVKELKRMKLSELSKDPRAGWNANVCLNFLNRVLQELRTKIIDDSTEEVNLLEWSPGSRALTVRHLDSEEARNYNFLPDWLKVSP